ncbi:MAG: hypothetical protein HY301_08855 [Verrucomicrobia bacterium]|nr:hypothetical protein [Verrucomicrobiota bacterium]
MNDKETVWAFDLGKASIGEAVRCGNEFLHKASLLIPAEFAETKTAATRRRMWRTRLAHKAREAWLAEVMRVAGFEPLKGRRITWNAKEKQWDVALGDPRLEREFAASGDNTCYTSCLLRIKLLRREKLEPWQIFKALHSAIQRRGYDPNIPWKTRAQRKSAKPDDEEGPTLTRMQEFEHSLEKMAPDRLQFRWPCYFDAWKMGLWNPARPDELKERIDCHAQSTRDQIVPRTLVDKEVRALVDAAAKFHPALTGKADYLLYGPPQRAYASFYADERKRHHLREGGANDWQGVLGQKIPRFDNRIIGKCVLMPRFNVCKIRTEAPGKLHPQSLVAAETVFLMKLKNMRLQSLTGQRGLTAQEINTTFNDPKRAKLGLTPTQWKKQCLSFGCKPLVGQHEEVEEPSFSGRSRFCRPALEIIKRLILSGDTPQVAHEKELGRLSGNTDPLKGLVKEDLKFLLGMGSTWEGIYIPNQKLDALARSTDDPRAAIRTLIGSQNDPIVRHRLTLFAERLDELAEKFGTPDSIALEFVREDFMGDKAKFEYRKFQRERAAQRTKSRLQAAEAGASAGAAGLKMELLEAQGGICLYTGEPLVPTALDDYVIDHIVPRAKGGPDSALNYILTTRRANDDKLDRTPYEWLSASSGWDAYVERVKKRITSLRNKKAQLLISPDAETLVERYTALAETAWISKLAQTIIGLRFKWPGGIVNGERKVIVVSGGLTGRIRRKYKLNSLLNPDAQSEEEAETKNRNDDRHHALDAMVISFMPNWARNAKYSGFFRFPDEVTRELFKKLIAEVIPQNVCFEKPALAETIYGARMDGGQKVIVQRAELMSLGYKPTTPGKSVFDLKYAGKQAQDIRDNKIRERVAEFITTNPTEASWREFCEKFCLKNKDGTVRSRVRFVRVTVGEPTEYKDLSKDGTGAYRKALKGHKGQIVYALASVNKKGIKKETIEVRPIYAFESFAKVAATLKQELGDTMQVKGFFQSGCMIETTRPAAHATRPLPPGKYLLNTIISDSGQIKLTTPEGKTYPDIPKYSLRSMIEAGMCRAT